MTRLSIRARLTAAFALAMILILALGALFTYLKVRSDLNEALDESLHSRADDVAALVASAAPPAPDLDGERLVEGEDAFVQVLSPSGAVVSSTLEAGAGAAISPSEVERAGQGPVLLGERALPGIDGEAKLLAREVEAGGVSFVVVVGATTQDRSEALAGLTGAFLIGGPVAILIASGLGYLLAGRALAPVEAMRARAAGITLERSGERLPLPHADDEIRRLGRTLNEMLDRIEASLERERVFVADASHELRTPLAILRAELELASKPERTPEELRAAVSSAAEEVERLSRLAEDLLVIARSDQGRLPIKREKVRMAELLERVSDRFQAQAGSKRPISIEADPGAEASLDPLRMEQALGNLVDNAIRHGAGGIRLSASSDKEDVVFRVSDEGAGTPDAFAERAFERFTRADEGRTGGGSGLGLAIVRVVARAHGGDASIHGSTVELKIPLISG